MLPVDDELNRTSFLVEPTFTTEGLKKKVVLLSRLCLGSIHVAEVISAVIRCLQPFPSSVDFIEDTCYFHFKFNKDENL